MDEKELQEIENYFALICEKGTLEDKYSKELIAEVRRLNEQNEQLEKDNQRYKQALEEIVNQHDKPHSDRWTLAEIAKNELKGEE
jgi:cell division protein FtsB